MKIFQYLLLIVLLCSSHQNRSATLSSPQYSLQRIKSNPSQNKTAYQANNNDCQFINKENKLFENALQEARAEFSQCLKDNPEDQITKYVEEILEKTLEINNKFKGIKKKIYTTRVL